MTALALAFLAGVQPAGAVTFGPGFGAPAAQVMTPDESAGVAYCKSSGGKPAGTAAW